MDPEATYTIRKVPFPVLMACGLFSAVLISGCGNSNASNDSTTTVAKSPNVFVLFDGSVQPESEPIEVVNGQTPITNLRWEQWGEDKTLGAGVQRASDCNPNCATGGVINSEVQIELSGISDCRGRLVYTTAFLLQSGDRYPLQLADCADYPDGAEANANESAPPDSREDQNVRTYEETEPCSDAPSGVDRLEASPGIGCAAAFNVAKRGIASRTQCGRDDGCRLSVDDANGLIFPLNCSIRSSSAGIEFDCNRHVSGAQTTVEKTSFVVVDE